MKATLISVSLDQNWVLKHMVSGNSTVVSEILTALEDRHVPGSFFILSQGFDSFSVISCRENVFDEKDVRDVITAVAEDLSVNLSLEELTSEMLSEKLGHLRETLTKEQRELLAEEFSIELIAPPAKSATPSAAAETKSLEDLIGLPLIPKKQNFKVFWIAVPPNSW